MDHDGVDGVYWPGGQGAGGRGLKCPMHRVAHEQRPSLVPFDDILGRMPECTDPRDFV